MAENWILPRPKQVEWLDEKGMNPETVRGIRTDFTGRRPPLPPLLEGLPEAAYRGAGIVSLTVADEDVPASPEGYVLEAAAGEVLIRSRSRAGLFYGMQTCQQLLEDAREAGELVPSCRIVDYPDLPYRAVQLDVKHHLDTIRYYYDAIDRLARYKVNAIIWELEDKLAYRRQPLVGADNAISIQEMAALTRYACERNVEISPLVQGLGHASFILKHDEYRDIRDDPENDWAFCPLNERTYEVQFDLYLDAIEATPGSRYLHIGGDEVEVGKSDLCRASGMSPLELHLHWLDRVCAFAEEHGRVPIMWDDMPLKHAGVYGTTHQAHVSQEEADRVWVEQQSELDRCRELFPNNCVYMRWNYRTPMLPGNRHALKWYAENGLKAMAATAAQTGSGWGMMPRNSGNVQPIMEFDQLSAEFGIEGSLCTAWDDGSPHIETHWRGLIAHAEYAWSTQGRTRDEYYPVYRRREFGLGAEDEHFAFQDKLEACLSFWDYSLAARPGRHRGMTEAPLDLPDPANPGAWQAAHGNLLAGAERVTALSAEIADDIAALLRTSRRNRYTLRFFRALNDLQSYNARILIALRASDIPSCESRNTALERICTELARYGKAKAGFLDVFSETRFLGNPAGYQADGNMHRHLASPGNTPDWMCVVEDTFNSALRTWIEA